MTSSSSRRPSPRPAPRPRPPRPPAASRLTVDAAAARHAISPDIYGIHFTTEAFAAELRLPVRRWGGNQTSRYNWHNNLSNHASDFYYENLPEDQTADQFVQMNNRTGTRSLITLPLSGWVAKDPANGDFGGCGFSTAKYGPQQSTDPYNPSRAYCGNGIAPDGSFIVGNDPADTSIVAPPAFAAEWVQHLKTTFGSAGSTGVRFYNLDNEPDLWNSTHRDVHPEPLSYDELRQRTEDYAAAVKAVDPAAQLLGPVSFGWSGYFYSALDLKLAAQNGYTSFPDREAHGNVALVPWYLGQMQAYETAHSLRLIDYLDLHFYPQNGVDLSSAGDAAKQALRLRSVRALWDPTYRDESYIGADNQTPDMRYVRLLPRMHDWVDANYPGTKLAITEYNWGALDHINGALAQADILGIFGREGLDLATLFNSPYGEGQLTPSSPGAFAFRMFRNYDGAGAAFGETSVAAASSDQAQLATYAAVRAGDGHLTVMVINKTGAALSGAVSLANFSAGSVAVRRYSPANLAAIETLPGIAPSSGDFSATFAANSITLLDIAPGAPGPTPTAGPPLRRLYLPLIGS